jgi:antitoxin component YwqK of YwqJK toxin-antitoxin module
MKAIIISLGLLISFGTEAQNTLKQESGDNGAPKSVYLQKGNRIQVTHYHLNGAVSESGYFLNNVPDGKWETFADNGDKTAEINYKKGKRHGEFRTWDAFTDSYLEMQYADGAMISANRWVKESGFAATK